MKYGRYNFGRPAILSLAASMARKLLSTKKKPGGGGGRKPSGGTSRIYKKPKLGDRVRYKSRKKKRFKRYNVGTDLLVAKRLKPIYISKNVIKGKSRFKFNQHKDVMATQISGAQGVTVLNSIGTTSQLKGNTSNLRANLLQWDIDPMLYNPYVVLNTSTYFPGPIASPNPSDRYGYRVCKQHLQFLNLESIPTECILMWLCPKVTTAVSPAAYWQTCLNNEERLTQNVSTSTAAPATTTTASGFQDSGAYGVHPAECRSFLKMWKILDQERFILVSGAQKNFSRDIFMNKVLTKQYLDNIPSGDEYIANITVVPLLITRGSLVGVTNGAAAVEVTYGPTKIGVMMSEEHRFVGLPMPNKDVARVHFGQLVNVPTANMDHIDADDDVQTVQIG